MFWGKKQAEKLDRLASAFEKLVETLEQREKGDAKGASKGDALEALSKVLSALAESAATSQKNSAQLLDVLLERASKQVMRGNAMTLAAASIEARKARKGANLARGGWEIPSFVASCEDCRAILANRQPAHSQDMIRHAAEQHLEQLQAAAGAAAANGKADG